MARYEAEAEQTAGGEINCPPSEGDVRKTGGGLLLTNACDRAYMTNALGFTKYRLISPKSVRTVNSPLFFSSLMKKRNKRNQGRSDGGSHRATRRRGRPCSAQSFRIFGIYFNSFRCAIFLTILNTTK